MRQVWVNVDKRVWAYSLDGAHVIFSQAHLIEPFQTEKVVQGDSPVTLEKITPQCVAYDTHRRTGCLSPTKPLLFIFLGQDRWSRTVMGISHAPGWMPCKPWSGEYMYSSEKHIIFYQKSLLTQWFFGNRASSLSSINVLLYWSYAEGNIKEGVHLSYDVRHWYASCYNADHDESLQRWGRSCVYSDTHFIIICH